MASKSNQIERNPYIDNLKGLLILLVVIGHFIEAVLSGSAMSKSLFIFIYAFHMPLFIFLNGVLFRNVSFDWDKIFSRSLCFLFLYLALKIIIFFTRMIGGENPGFHLLSEDGIPWYLFVLAIYYPVSYFLRKFDRRYLLFIFTVLSLFSGYDTEIGDFLILSRAIVFYPCFLLGWLCNVETLEKILKRQWIKVVSVFLLAGFMIVSVQYINEIYFLRPLFTGRNPYEKLGDYYIYGPCLRLLTYAISTILSIAILSLTPHWELKGITHFGKNSLQIYFWHRIVLYFLTYAGIFHFLESGLGHRYSRCIWLLCAIPVTWLLALDFFGKPFEILSKNLKAKSS